MEMYCYDFSDESKREKKMDSNSRFMASKKFVFIKLDNLTVLVCTYEILCGMEGDWKLTVHSVHGVRIFISF